MCKTFGKLPDDVEIEEMDPMMRMWMFYNWIEDHNENVDLFKHHGYLIGSFINPEMAKEITQGPTYATSDDEFEATSRMVREASLKAQKEQTITKKRRKKKIVKDN